MNPLSFRLIDKTRNTIEAEPLCFFLPITGNQFIYNTNLKHNTVGNYTDDLFKMAS
jgi:hypothetical protein